MSSFCSGFAFWRPLTVVSNSSVTRGGREWPTFIRGVGVAILIPRASLYLLSSYTASFSSGLGDANKNSASTDAGFTSGFGDSFGNSIFKCLASLCVRFSRCAHLCTIFVKLYYSICALFREIILGAVGDDVNVSHERPLIARAQPTPLFSVPSARG
eukprot:Lankesteria_metandrocarpae@DN2202_c0_g1_i1.p1